MSLLSTTSKPIFLLLALSPVIPLVFLKRKEMGESKKKKEDGLRGREKNPL